MKIRISPVLFLVFVTSQSHLFAQQSWSTSMTNLWSQIKSRVSSETSPSMSDGNGIIQQGTFADQEAQQVQNGGYASYWNHNGSTMGLIVRGNQRTLVYVKVRKGLQGLVKPGTILFTGTSAAGKYTGSAYRFSKGLPPIAYHVSGPILGGGAKVVLTGKAPIRNPDGSVRKFKADRLEFTFLRK